MMQGAHLWVILLHRLSSSRGCEDGLNHEHVTCNCKFVAISECLKHAHMAVQVAELQQSEAFTDASPADAQRLITTLQW